MSETSDDVANERIRKRRNDRNKKEQGTLQSRSRLSLFRNAASLRWPTQMHVMQGIAVRNKSDEVWKRDRGATVRFLDDRPKKAKGVGSAERARERETENTTEGKKSKRKSFPLVERNTHRFATIQRFARARARCTAKRRIMQRASSLTQSRARSV